MLDDANQNAAESSNETPTSWPARIGGLLIFLGTGLSMVLEGWQADAAMGVALLGFVLALAGRGKTKNR